MALLGYRNNKLSQVYEIKPDKCIIQSICTSAETAFKINNVSDNNMHNHSAAATGHNHRIKDTRQ